MSVDEEKVVGRVRAFRKEWSRVRTRAVLDFATG